MKKLMLLAAMVAMVLATAAPAFAQQTSGGATFNAAISNELGNQCAQILNQQNTGNVAQEQNVEANQDVLQLNLALLLLVLAGEIDITQINANEQNVEANQTGISQAQAAAQACTQALTIH